MLEALKWSHSSLKTYKTCPHLFKQIYILKDRRELPNARLGNALHEYASNLINKKVNLLDDILTKWQVSQEDRELVPVAISHLTQFIETTLAKKRIESEKRVECQIGPYSFVAVLDIVFNFDDRRHIYDFKFSKSSKYYKEYIQQAKIYNYIMEKVYGKKPTEVYLYYPITNEIIPIKDLSLSEDELVSQIELIIADRKFETKTHKLCRFCQYQKDCPAFHIEEP